MIPATMAAITTRLITSGEFRIIPTFCGSAHDRQWARNPRGAALPPSVTGSKLRHRSALRLWLAVRNFAGFHFTSLLLFFRHAAVSAGHSPPGSRRRLAGAWRLLQLLRRTGTHS